MTQQEGIELFLARAADAVGAARIVEPATAQSRYGRNTMGVQREIPLALRPANRDEVRALVRIAHETGTRLYPISTGNNWGYGSSNPVEDGCVVLDLSAMQALEFDPATGLLTVEPGVTQRMLFDYLQRNGHAFMCPVTGAGPDCSLVGNALERGYGITPIADHFAAVMRLEAVLADGSVYRSPLTELGATLIDKSFKWGFGPYLDGLFAQGNFGIVTEMTIALARRPERVEAFFFGIPEDAGLESAVAAVQRILSKLGSVGGSINLMNRRRVLSMMVPYPRDKLSADGLIPDEWLAKVAKSRQVMSWMGAGALYGDARLVSAAKKIVRAELRGNASRLMFFTSGRLALAGRAVGLVPGALGRDLQDVIATLQKTLKLLEGEPSTIALPLAYWMSGTLPPGEAMNPARDGCGLMWYSPLLSMQPRDVRAYVQMVDRICRKYRVEPLITLTSLSDRCFDSTVPLLFDRQSEADATRIRNCFDELLDTGVAQGFIPYRAHVSTMDRFIANPDATCWRMVSALRRAVDPQGIIAPGRYAPRD